jgi:XisI protein
LLLDNQRLKLLVFDRRAEVIVRWIPLDTYRQSIEKVLCDYAQLPYAYGEVEREVVSDRHGDHYLLLAVGWDGAQRVHGSVVHIDIIDGKVWIQRDGTELALLRSS